MDPLVLAAGTALIGAMAADAWQQTHTAVAWWRKVHPGHLTRALAAAEQTRVQQIIINARARDQARQYIAGGDQHITGSRRCPVAGLNRLTDSSDAYLQTCVTLCSYLGGRTGCRQRC
jgi:hypothetical protein